MGLEELVTRIEQRTREHMHAGTRRRLATDINALKEHTITDDTQRYVLDDARAALGYRAIAQKRRGRTHAQYSSWAMDLEALTTPKNTFFDDSSRTGITLLMQSPTNYQTRFNELKSYFTNAEGLHYTDALLCREHLRNDSYLRRRSKQDGAFAQEVSAMIEEFDEYIGACRDTIRYGNRSFNAPPKRFSTARKWGARAAMACFGAVMTYCSIPTDWLIGA